MFKESNPKNNKIVLKGKRVVLSSIVKSDFKLLRKWFNNDEVMKYFMINKDDINFLLKFLIKFFKPLIITKLFKYFLKNGFALIINYNDEPVGFVIFWLIDKSSKTYRIPIAIGNPKYWGKGLGRDTIETAKNYIFNNLNGEIIIAGDISKENSRSVKMFVSCGFQELSTSQADYFRNLSIPKQAKKISVGYSRKDDTISLILKR